MEEQSHNEHEAAAAMSKAQELLEKYNLSMTDVSSPEFTKGMLLGREFLVLDLRIELGVEL